MSSFSPKRIYENYNLQLFLCSGLLTFSSANFGFDQSGFSQVQAMNHFAKQFGGTCTKSGSCSLDSTRLSFLNGFPFLTFALGSLIGSMISERYGRRWTVFSMSLFALVSATVCITSKTYGQILAGRCLNYIYAGMELSVITVFQSEIMPVPIRGFAVASYQMSISVGVLLMSIVCHFTSTIKSNNSWRIPLALFYLAPTVVASAVWFVPESPRWLLAHGHEEKARCALARLRVKNDIESIEAELDFIKLGLQAYDQMETSTYSQLFKGRSLRRTMITIGTCFFLQWGGQSLNSQYGTVFVKSLNTFPAFNFTLITSSCQLVATLVAMYLLDVVGRRPIMIGGILMQGIMMLTIGGLGTVTGSGVHKADAGIVGCVVVYAVSYSIGWAPSNWVLVAEVSEQKLRDKTQRIGTWVNFASNCGVTFSIPYLINAPSYLGGKVGFIFGSLCMLGAAWGYFFIPECKGRTPEEINLLFEHRVSAIQSPRWHPSDVQGELQVRAAEHGVVRNGEIGADKIEMETVERV